MVVVVLVKADQPAHVGAASVPEERLKIDMAMRADL